MNKGLLLIGYGDILQSSSMQFRQQEPSRKIEILEISPDQEINANEASLDGYDPKDWDVFAAIGMDHLNFTRLSFFYTAKQLGFKNASFIHSRAAVDSTADIGQNCYIGDNAVIASGVRIEYNTYIGAGVIIGHKVTVGTSAWIGDGCIVGASAHIGSHSILGKGAMIDDGVHVGKFCELQIARLYAEDVPEKTYHHRLFDQPVRVYE